MAKQRDIQDVRRGNLKVLIAQWGGPTNLAKKLGLAGPSYLSQLLSGLRPITEKFASKTEVALELPTGWISAEQKEKAMPAAVDHSLVAKVAELIGAILEEEKLQVAPTKFSDLVVMVYEDAVTSGSPNECFIKQLVKLLR